MSEELAARLMARIAVPPMPFAPDTYTAGRMDQFTEMITQLRALPEVDKEQVLADAHARIEDLHYGDDNLLIGTGYQLAVNDALAALTQPQTEGRPGYPLDEDGDGKGVPMFADEGAATAADADLAEQVDDEWRGKVIDLADELDAEGKKDVAERVFALTLAFANTEPGPYAKAFREKFPVPEFPGIEKEES